MDRFIFFKKIFRKELVKKMGQTEEIADISSIDSNKTERVLRSKINEVLFIHLLSFILSYSNPLFNTVNIKTALCNSLE
jgi:hypothetical protein